ncbi:hypothetical protein CCAN12_810120 [Capnocytophaga canimorsus]|uniref:Uncharacterized protein n=1 Tax=Capnocytophaga canimorsus TaxID=28188 RepID=A0A0B7HVU3_9FLAO|nr:hypothetical protein [Capnocytophaga canimorsus]MDT9500035.1 hypothetical protein [Capnocytophaga canimorsus]CEN41633.1 hypothetical protein CCAN12_810120 [Capnocytophaga canimorsus]
METHFRYIDKYYQKGLSASGEKPYDGFLLFKMLLIGMWNNLSDVNRIIIHQGVKVDAS